MPNDEFPEPREPVIEHVELDPVESTDSESANSSSPSNPLKAKSQEVTDAPVGKGSMARGKLAAIGGGAAAIGLVLGLVIGWIAFDDGGNGGGRRDDRGRMSQEQGPGGGRQDGGGMRGGSKMMPGDGRGQMRPDNANPIDPTAPTTQGSVVPQTLQQG